MPRPDWLTARPIAHRGYHDMNGAVFENTMPAFERAIDNDFAIRIGQQRELRSRNMGAVLGSH